MICACTDTSSADTGSSRTIRRGCERQRAGHADPLALAARELVRVAVEVLGVQPDPLEQLPDLRLHLSAGVPWRRSGAPMIWPTRRRGFSEANGSWNTICICAAQRLHLLAARPWSRPAPRNLIVPSVESISRMIARDMVVFPQPDSPTSPSVSPSLMEKVTSFTAWTRATSRSKRIPSLIGKKSLR